MLKYPLEWVPNDMNKKNKDPNKIWRKAKENPRRKFFFSKDQSNFLVGAGQHTTKVLKAVKFSHLMILNI